MIQMNANLLKTALYVCAFAAAGLPAWAGPLQRADVAGETAWGVHLDCDSPRPTAAGPKLLGLQRADVAGEPAWVLHLDCDSLRPTALGQYLLAEMEKPEAQAKFDAFQTIFNFDLRKQLHGLTLYSTGKVPEDGVLLVYADFDPSRLVTMAKAAQGYQSTTFKQHVIHNWVDEKKKAKLGVKPRVYEIGRASCRERV